MSCKKFKGNKDTCAIYVNQFETLLYLCIYYLHVYCWYLCVNYGLYTCKSHLMFGSRSSFLLPLENLTCMLDYLGLNFAMDTPSTFC
jgi:hypothetical protein